MWPLTLFRTSSTEQMLQLGMFFFFLNAPFKQFSLVVKQQIPPVKIKTKLQSELHHRVNRKVLLVLFVFQR